MSEDYKPIGAEPLPEEQPDERGSIQRAADDFKSIPDRSEVTQALYKGTQAAAKRAAAAGWTKTASFFTAFGPEIIAVILTAIFVIVVGLVSFYLLSSTYQSFMGTRPNNASDPANNKQDALNLKDIICLNTAIEKNATTKDGKLPKNCVEPIRARAKLIITNAEAIKGKITKDDVGNEAANKILDDLIAAAKKAEAVTAGMSITVVQKIRDEITTQSELANNNALIVKSRGYSVNAQKIINYCAIHACDQITVTGRQDGCQDTNKFVIKNVFGGNPGAGSSLSGIPEGAPTAANLKDASDALANGGIPIWHIRGDGRGQHWIMLLKINGTNITYFDAADGKIHTDPSTVPSKYTWYFGSPSNAEERGYVFKP